ncbi:ABC transporter permease [Desulfoluna butyratoxydans]|uniref:Abc-2 family transporter protein n=1 Tax=Desulfoluna butyratoxydans TaxID=231438 RepID=A0A4U8YWR0_9BACT|nr:ABC transporter permease [Desulfoluna butyratoxydans]VFQ45873.1 abc-2 family transporter protein [Desulfoluna butyratoxydans]
MNWFRLVAGELSLALGDSATRLLLLGSVVLYAFFYPYPYSPEVQDHVPVVVVDLDHTSLSRQLIRMAGAGDRVRVAARAATLDRAKALCRSGEVQGIFLVPEGFQGKVLKGTKAEVAVWSEALSFFTYRQVATGLLSASGTLSAGIEIKRLRAAGLAEEAAFAATEPLPLQTVQLFNPAGGYGTYVVPLVFVLILQQTLLMGVGMVAGARSEAGDSSWFSPGPGLLGAVAAVSSKLVAYLLLYSIHALAYFGVLHRFYRFVARGAVCEMAVVMALFLVSVILFALTLSVLFPHRETSLFVLIGTSMPAIFLSGISWPVEVFPPWLRIFSYVIPSTAGIDGFLRVSTMGAGLGDVAKDVAILMGLVVVYFFSAVWVFFKKSGG